MKKASIIIIFFLISFFLYADENYPLTDREIYQIKSDIRRADYTARLRLVSLVVLDDLKKKKKYDSYDYISTYEVIETYKGTLPKYILFRTGDIIETDDKEQYRIGNTNSVNNIIISFCKGKNHYYFPETHSSLDDTPKIRKIAKEAVKEKLQVKEKYNCNSNDHLMAKKEK